MALSGTIADEWPLVGRDSEVDVVRRLLQRGSRGVVVAGPAGVGKTRLAGECLALAMRSGFVPIRVSATRASASLPLGAFAPLLPELAPGSEPAQVLGKVARSMLERGEGRPVAVLVDDAHFLDDSSAALTHQLIGRGGTFVVTTVRTGEPSSDAVVALWKDGLATRLDLKPFSEEQVSALLSRVLGGLVDAGTVRRLWERTQGNPLFLRELLSAALEGGAIAERDGVWRLHGNLPASTRLIELVEARLAGIGDEGRTLLERIALGEPLDVGLLDETANAALARMEQRGLASVELNGRRLQACLAHPLYGEVLRARLSPFRSRSITGMLAAGVIRAGAHRRDDPLRVATWSLKAGIVPDFDVALTGARQAFARNDLDLAERLAREAFEAVGGFEAGLLLGLVISHSGRVKEAEATLKALSPSSDVDRAILALTRIPNLFLGGYLNEAVTVVEEAESAISDPARLAEVKAWRPIFLFLDGRVAESRALVESLLPQVSGRSLVMLCATGAWTFATAGKLSAALEAAERGLTAHLSLEGSPLWYGPYLHLFARCEAFSWAGIYSEAENLATSEYSKALAQGSRPAQGWLEWAIARALLGQGKVESAARHARSAVAVLRETGQVAMVGYVAETLARAFALSGKPREAKAALNLYDELPRRALEWEAELLGARAWTAAAGGDVSAARKYLQESAGVARSQESWVLESSALHDMARLGRPGEVAPRLAELAQIIEGPLAPARRDHAAALTKRDANALEKVSIAFEKMAAILLAAEASADAAVAWRREGEPRKAAVAERRARVLAARCEGAKTPALTAVTARATLSGQELEIVRLAAAGMSNKQIAERLSFSVRTVENKLHAAYGKLGVRGRVELANALTEV